MHIKAPARVIPSAPFKLVLEGLEEDTLVSLNQVYLGLLDIVTRLPSDHIVLFTCLLQQEAHWLVLESVI
ncbi:MAG: hypothetical protein ACKPKO_17250, partial [Candidatus Fonsibacter sp.]